MPLHVAMGGGMSIAAPRPESPRRRSPLSTRLWAPSERLRIAANGPSCVATGVTGATVMKPSPSIAAGLSLFLVPAFTLIAGGPGAAQPDCAAYARQQSGFDPARPPPPAATANPRVAGSGTRARGAAAGAVIGGVAGDAGKGAAAG